MLLLGFVESIIVSVDAIVTSRGYAGWSACMSFISTIVWFVLVKLAITIPWEMILAYACVFALGAYIAVRFTRKLKVLVGEKNV